MNTGNFKIWNAMPAGAWKKWIQSGYLMFPAAAWSRAVCKLVREPNLSLSLSCFKSQGEQNGLFNSVEKKKKDIGWRNFAAGLTSWVLEIEEKLTIDFNNYGLTDRKTDIVQWLVSKNRDAFF